MTTEKGHELHPVNRVRHETFRGLLKGLKAVIEQGCVIKRVTIIPVNGDELEKRARRIGGAPPGRRPKEVKQGRPVARPKKPGETDEQKKKRLGAERAQKYRARKKAAATGDKPRPKKRKK